MNLRTSVRARALRAAGVFGLGGGVNSLGGPPIRPASVAPPVGGAADVGSSVPLKRSSAAASSKKTRLINLNTVIPQVFELCSDARWLLCHGSFTLISPTEKLGGEPVRRALSMGRW
ncbi:hypothetical protein GCM10009745_03440 [Kribbella yunnanensis]|uniref:Uncharacterized protein n=1 Tax=Kribbella yunnanensis TaxID=190194 RepID=A0ABN2G429_9ACTN